MNKKVKTIIAIILNLFTFVASTYITADMFFLTGEGNMAVSSWNVFKYFTIDSNILCGIVCLIYAVYQILNLVKGKEMPKWAIYAKSALTAAISVTFFTVIFFLGPTQGFGIMFAGRNMFLHAINPLAAMIAYMFLEDGKLNYKDNLWTIAPTFVYSIFYVLFVVIIGNWVDFYGFTFGGQNYLVPFVLIIMYAVSYAIGAGELAIKNLINKQKA